jgi:hypothetical protein
VDVGDLEDDGYDVVDVDVGMRGGTAVVVVAVAALGDDVNDIIPGSTVGPPSMMIIGTGTMQLPSVGLVVHVGRLLLLPLGAWEDEGDDDVATPLLFIFLDDLSLFDLPLLPPSSSLS